MYHWPTWSAGSSKSHIKILAGATTWRHWYIRWCNTKLLSIISPPVYYTSTAEHAYDCKVGNLSCNIFYKKMLVRAVQPNEHSWTTLAVCKRKHVCFLPWCKQEKTCCMPSGARQIVELPAKRIRHCDIVPAATVTKLMALLCQCTNLQCYLWPCTKSVTKAQNSQSPSSIHYGDQTVCNMNVDQCLTLHYNINVWHFMPSVNPTAFTPPAASHGQTSDTSTKE